MAPVAQAFLGANGASTFLVLGLTSDELRANGGFVAGVWEVTFDQGALTHIQYHDVVDVDDVTDLSQYPLPPTPLREHMNAWFWLTRDVTWDPDFPTTAQIAQDIYWIGQRHEVDGVIAINQWFLQALVEALGGFISPVDGQLVPPEQFVTFLEREKTEAGRSYVDVVAQQVLSQLQRPSSPATMFRLADTLARAFKEKRLMLYSNNPAVQQTLVKRGWAGALYAGPGDSLIVVDSNVGWSKVDRNIQRATRYEVRLHLDAPPEGRLTLSYFNASGPQATSCDEQWMYRGATYEEWKNACYWNFFRVYVPSGVQLTSASSLPLPPGSVAEIIGAMHPDEETLQVGVEHNRSVFSGFFTVAAGQQRQISFDYSLPEWIVERQGDRLLYRLVLQRQPGVLGREVTVRMSFPSEYRLEQSSLPPAEEDGTSVTFNMDLGEDTEVTLVLASGQVTGR